MPSLHASTARSLDPRVVFASSPWTGEMMMMMMMMYDDDDNDYDEPNPNLIYLIPLILSSSNDCRSMATTIDHQF